MAEKTIRRVLMMETFGQRLLGLMGRTRWPGPWEALCFPNCRAVHTFFTFLKPDILFLDGEKRILRVFEKVGPRKVFWGPSASRYCLELPGGFILENKLSEGDVVLWP